MINYLGNMENRFKASDMIYQGLLTKEVVRKIELHHLPILNSLKSPITSIVGYRSFTYEISKGRDGTSQHTFVRRGAVDIASPEMWKLWKELKETPYTRICFYGTFFHCDYKTDDRQYFINDNGWNYADLQEMEDTIYESARSTSLDILYTIA